MYRLLFALVMLAPVGCAQGTPVTEPGEADAADGGGGSILGKKTQDIGEFDPAAGRIVSDSKIRATNPITGPLEAMGPMLEKVSKLGIDHALSLYYATNGHYPKTHDDFMTQVIKANRIQLPKLPAGAEYQYDVANHKLVVVKAEGR